MYLTYVMMRLIDAQSLIEIRRQTPGLKIANSDNTPSSCITHLAESVAQVTGNAVVGV